MTTLIAPDAKFRATDSNGNPLSGGKLFTYIASTTTKANTFTDSGGGTANANPVILNTRGEADVWLTAGSAYKFVLAPSTDTDPPTNAIWTVDNIIGGVATPVSIANGGTGATTAAGALSNLAGLGLAGGTMTGGLVMSGASINEASTTLVSAATVNIGAAAANYITITGTTGITAFDTAQAGTRRILEFSGSLTLTHNATSLILPDGANLKTLAGDVFVFVSEGSGNWRCVQVPARLADGAAKAWANIAGAGTNNASLNVSGVVRNSAGDYTISFTTAFSSANYAVAATAYGNTLIVTITTQLAGSCNVVVRQTGTGTATDAQFTIAFFGRQ